ncbi:MULTISPECIES: CHASE3 domain-containing protein [unclassified Massilia]|uniref:CHASE3 domain-containing protein n=1 Tax=unclassified Massilia TaxID=2609279 RepID=UPI0009EBD99F|nr:MULTISPECIES: CHASE3 domain-containing protein [unclassified Massilia]
MYFSTDAAPRPGRSLPVYQTLLCAICIFILVLNGVSLVRNLDSLKATNARQAQADRVSARLQYVNLLVTDADSGLRSYFLSGSDTYLGPLRTAERELDGQFGALQTLLADNPSQLKNLSQLQTLARRRMGLMHEALEVYRRGGLDDIVAISRTQEDQVRMDEIRLQVVVMMGEQNDTLAAGGAAFYDQYRHTALLGVGINMAAIAVLVLFYNLIRRGFRLRLAAERALQDSNDHLETLVADRTEQLSVLSRHLISVSEEEKARLARELHDEMGANLTAIGMYLATVGEQIRASHPEQAAALGCARATLVETVQLKRRIVEDLRPSLLDNMGLAAALQSYCEDFARATRLDCEALVEGDVDGAGPMQAIALFRIAQEALNNVAKYAQARHVVLHLAREGDAVALEVSDDGVGIPPDAMRRPKSHGLLGMRERALLLGGTLKVERGVNGVGTCVQAWVPLASPALEMEVKSDQSSAETPVALGGGTSRRVELGGDLMRVQRPSADGHTRF